MKKYFIKYGLGGGFGGANNFKIEECENDQKASILAWELACEEYETYNGMHGLRDVAMIMEEETVDEEEANLIWEEERESWLDYHAEIYEAPKHDEIIKMLS